MADWRLPFGVLPGLLAAGETILLSRQFAETICYKNVCTGRLANVARFGAVAHTIDLKSLDWDADLLRNGSPAYLKTRSDWGALILEDRRSAEEMA